MRTHGALIRIEIVCTHASSEKQPGSPAKTLNDRSVIKEINGTKQSAETVGCKNELVGERSTLEERTHASHGRQSRSKNVSLSNTNVGENSTHDCADFSKLLFLSV
ncbi:hypothetical protein AHAS_Ahas09G0072400 [Arachis hypogaea]